MLSIEITWLTLLELGFLWGVQTLKLIAIKHGLGAPSRVFEGGSSKLHFLVWAQGDSKAHAFVLLCSLRFIVLYTFCVFWR